MSFQWLTKLLFRELHSHNINKVNHCMLRVNVFNLTAAFSVYSLLSDLSQLVEDWKMEGNHCYLDDNRSSCIRSHGCMHTWARACACMRVYLSVSSWSCQLLDQLASHLACTCLTVCSRTAHGCGVSTDSKICFIYYFLLSLTAESLLLLTSQ